MFRAPDFVGRDLRSSRQLPKFDNNSDMIIIEEFIVDIEV
jgi:hypothetical protein